METDIKHLYELINRLTNRVITLENKLNELTNSNNFKDILADNNILLDNHILLNICKHKPELIEDFLNSSLNTETVYNYRNTEGYNFLHILSRYNPDYLIQYLDINLINSVTNDGHTILHIVSRYKPKYLIDVLNHEYVTSDLINKKSQNNYSLAHTLALNNSKYLRVILNNSLFDRELLKLKTRLNNTILHILIENDFNDVVLFSELCDELLKDLIDVQNDNNKTILKLLVEKERLDLLEIVMNGDIKNSNTFKNLIFADNIIKLVKCKTNTNNFTHIDTELYSIIMNTKHINKTIFNNVSYKLLTDYAYLNNSDFLNSLISNKLCNKKLYKKIYKIYDFVCNYRMGDRKSFIRSLIDSVYFNEVFDIKDKDVFKCIIDNLKSNEIFNFISNYELSKRYLIIVFCRIAYLDNIYNINRILNYDGFELDEEIIRDNYRELFKSKNLMRIIINDENYIKLILNNRIEHKNCGIRNERGAWVAYPNGRYEDCIDYMFRTNYITNIHLLLASKYYNISRDELERKLLTMKGKNKSLLVYYNDNDLNKDELRKKREIMDKIRIIDNFMYNIYNRFYLVIN